MTTKRQRKASLRIRTMDEAALSVRHAELSVAAHGGTRTDRKTTRAKGKLSAIAHERRRRENAYRGDERWVAGKWLPDDRIAWDGVPDLWTAAEKGNAVVTVLRGEFGEENFNRIFGYDSRRWNAELERRAGPAADRARFLRDIRNREFKAFAVKWAREARAVQEKARCKVWSAARQVATTLAANLLRVATFMPHADDPHLGNVRRLLDPANGVHRAFMNKLTRALHDVVKPLLEAIEPIPEITDPNLQAIAKPARATIRARPKRDPQKSAELLAVVKAAAKRARTSC